MSTVDGLTILGLVGEVLALERRGVLTFDPARREFCCGLERDADGFCTYKPRHPIYSGVGAAIERYKQEIG